MTADELFTLSQLAERYNYTEQEILAALKADGIKAAGRCAGFDLFNGAAACKTIDERIGRVLFADPPDRLTS